MGGGAYWERKQKWKERKMGGARYEGNEFSLAKRTVRCWLRA